jgi:hypothetical protein
MVFMCVSPLNDQWTLTVVVRLLIAC